MGGGQCPLEKWRGEYPPGPHPTPTIHIIACKNLRMTQYEHMKIYFVLMLKYLEAAKMEGEG